MTLRWKLNTLIFLFACYHSVNGNADIPTSEKFGPALAKVAMARTQHQVTYDGSYVKIPYPGGDVPANMGVCTDVVIRSYRQLGIDLQKLVHEDIKKHFHLYPAKRIWGQHSPDSNIDHRRVPNLETFFSRHGKSFSISNNKEDYAPGDIVSWMLPNNLPHIGIVSNEKSEDGTPLIIHNIGLGPKLDNMLFSYKITGHFQYKNSNNIDTMRHGNHDF